MESSQLILGICNLKPDSGRLKSLPWGKQRAQQAYFCVSFMTRRGISNNEIDLRHLRAAASRPSVNSELFSLHNSVNLGATGPQN